MRPCTGVVSRSASSSSTSRRSHARPAKSCPLDSGAASRHVSSVVPSLQPPSDLVETMVVVVVVVVVREFGSSLA